MKHYLVDGNVWGIADGFPVPEGAIPMTEQDVDRIYNPEKYLSDKEKAQLARERMPTLSPIEFDLKLVQHNLYDAVQDLISNNLELKIAYNRATFFSRTSEFIEQARQLLDLTDEQVDEMWLS